MSFESSASGPIRAIRFTSLDIGKTDVPLEKAAFFSMTKERSAAMRAKERLSGRSMALASFASSA